MQNSNNLYLIHIFSRMQNLNIEPIMLIKKAEKMEKFKRFYEYFYPNSIIKRYYNIANLYKTIGIIYTQTQNDKNNAIKYLNKSLDFYKKSNSNYSNTESEIKSISILLGALYTDTDIDYELGIKHYENVIKFYMRHNDILNILHYYEIIGDIYIKHNFVELGIQIFEKILSIIGNQNNKFNEYKKNAIEKISNFLVNSNDIQNYLKAAKLYLNYVDLSEIKSASFIAFNYKYIYLSIISFCAYGDYIKANSIYNKYFYENERFIFLAEKDFIKKILKTIETNDYEMLSDLCGEKDKISSLEPQEYKLLQQIKKNIIYNKI